MNYTLSISSSDTAFKKSVKKLSKNYTSTYTKDEVAENAKAILKELNLTYGDVSVNNSNIVIKDSTEKVMITATLNSTTEKVVIKFAEHKYFKNLKYLFGAYQTELSQNEGASEVTTDAYIRSVIGTSFKVTDLSTADKFVSAEEVDLRSTYMEQLNNVLFKSTRDLEGEIYGIKEDGQIFVAGKRLKPFQRLYDTKLMSALDDIVPATVSGTTVTKAITSRELYYDETTYDNPKYMNVLIKKPLNNTYDVSEEPSFKYFKNLLVFEAKVNLASPRIAEIPTVDDGTFQKVTDILQNGDTIESAIALDGAGTRTHTITTQLKKQCKYLAANGSDLVAIMSDNKVYTAKNVNFDAITNVTLEDSGTEFSESGAQLVDMIYDDNEKSWVGTFGYEAEMGTDFYGDNYYKTMVSKSLNNVAAGGNSYMYATTFTSSPLSPVTATFKNKSSDNLIKVVDTTALTIADDYGQVFGQSQTSLVNPNDIALSSFVETEVASVSADADISGPVVIKNGKTYVQKMYEGPYIVNSAEYESGSNKMYQKLFSDNDVSIVLQQDYIFVKTQLYTVDESGAYTRSMTRGKHWLGAKLPITLDTTMLKLRAMPVSGASSCYAYVLDDIKVFNSWALDTAQKAEIGDYYTFTNLSLEETYTKEELNNYKESIEPLGSAFVSKKESGVQVGRGLLTYAQFLSLGVKFYDANNTEVDATVDSYASCGTAITKVTFETALPLDTQLRIDSSARYVLTGNADNSVVITSKAYGNFIDFEEAYRAYLLYALTYVRGVRQYDNFGAKLVTEIYSIGSKVYFRCYTGDVFFIEKKYLHKASEIESIENWRVSKMPTASYINGWDSGDLKTMAGYETVTLKDGKELPINNKERRCYFFKLTSKLYSTSDNLHLFFGGYAYPAKTIKDKYKDMGGGSFDTTQEWWQNNITNWISDNDDSGKTPVVIYSDDGGMNFQMLPVKGYIAESLFTDGKDRQVTYFSETPEGYVAAYVAEGANSFTTNQIVIHFDDLGNVDPTSTEWKQVGIPVNGEVRSFYTDEGKITYTTGRTGYGVDIDLSQTKGSDTFNFDYTGNTAITLPSGLTISKVQSGKAITFNKSITEDSSITGTYRVLFAAYTSLDIPFQENYMTTDSSILKDYLKSDGSLKVNSIKQVYNKQVANRMYMDNFPTVAQDTSKVYYTYDSNGDVEPMTNNYNNKIIECDETGEKFSIKVGSNTYSIDFASSLGNGISESQLVAQGSLAHTLDELQSNADYMETDTDLTEKLLNSKSYLKMTGYSQDTLTAYFNHNASSLITILGTYGYRGAGSLGSDGYVCDIPTDISTWIVKMEGQWGEGDNNFASATERFIWKDIGSHNYYLFDKKYNVYVLKNRAYIAGTLSVPYTFYNGGNGVTVIADPIIQYSDTTKNMIAGGALANGIYYHPMGYGGLRNNTSLVENAPWDRDSVAFENRYLKNSLGDYVFVTDRAGNRIKMHGASQLMDSDSYTIDYDSFLNSGLHQTKNESTNTSTSFYKLKKTDIHQCHTCSYVKQGSKVGLRFYKNTTKITDIRFTEDEKTPYVGYLYNSSGEKCFNATLDNGMLIVGKALDAAGSTLTATFLLTFQVGGKTFTETVTSTFTLSGSNSVPWIDEITDDKDTVFYYKNYGLISTATNGVKKETYKLKFTDNDGDFDIANSNVIANNISYSVGSDGAVTISYAAKQSYEDANLTLNGTVIWQAPSIEISDELVSDGTVNYLGDDIADSSLTLPLAYISSYSNTEVVTLSYSKSFSANVGDIVSGAYGYSISKAPKYSTFQSLLSNEGVVIEKDSSYRYTKDQLSSISIAEIASDNSEVKLNTTLPKDYDDDKEHYFRFKILTVSEQEPSVKNMNNPAWYYELTKEEMKHFAPNRVWYNPKGSPVPPIKSGDKIFNSENNYAYYSNDYTNSNGARIYLCDEAGHYINYNENGESYRLDSGNGDCSSNIYMGVDNRYVSPEPINATCQDWYYDNMYSSGKEVNPLWQVIHIVPEIENKKWVQTVKLCRYKKSGNTQLLTEDIDHPYVSINSLSKIEDEDGTLKVVNDFDAFNKDEGEVNLLLSEGDNYYQELLASDDANMTLYGLNFAVSKIKDMFNSSDYDLSSTLQASYSVNTLRDFTTPIQGDGAIANITEMGIFDKSHKMIAYAQFPPIEYRTDSQHASFTAVIYHGNMTERE